MSARGFALAELIVVLAIAGVLATLVAPTLWNYARTASLQAAARELATSINLGRQIAISRNTTVCVEVAAATNVRLRTGGCGGEIWTGPGTDASGAIGNAPPRLRPLEAVSIINRSFIAESVISTPA